MTQAFARSQPTMTVDDYLVWARALPDCARHELIDGEIVMMAPERYAHARLKVRLFTLLDTAIASAGLALQAIPDGVGVRIDNRTCFIPDAMVNAGEAPEDDAQFVDAPIVVIEVVSPTTGHRDSGIKLRGYFRLPSVLHYLLIYPDERMIVHHRRGLEETLVTRMLRDGAIDLTPPGLRLDVLAVFAG